jgi:ABC-type phosphate transport system substrate-binding protein
MSHGTAVKHARVKMLAGAALFCVSGLMATSAMSTTLYGGGASLPAGAYFGWNFLPNNRLTLPTNVTSTSLLGAWAASTGNAIQYCQTGSGGGKRVLNGDTGSTPGNPSLVPGGACNVGFANSTVFGISQVSPTGFQIPATAVGQPDFIASDAPYTTAEYQTFVNLKGPSRGEPVQFPAVGGAIAIVYKNSDVNVPHKMNLTTAQVCQIFAGNITFWNQLNPSFLPKPIKVVYRSDDSGVSFNLANHLSAVCGTISAPGSFQTYQTFFSPVVSNTQTVIAHLPLNSSTSKIPATGDPGVILTVVHPTNDGAIGYAEVADALDHTGSGVNPVDYATIDGRDPVADLPATMAVRGLFDEAISGVDIFGRPTLSAVIPNSTAKCLGIVDPNSYANLVRPFYSILTVSYLVANQKGNGADVTALRSLMFYPVIHPVAQPGFTQLTGTNISGLKALACLAI